MLLSVTLGAVLAAVIGVLVLGEAGWFRRSSRLPPPDGSTAADYPHVDIIVPVHNEARWIEQKLRNLKALRYPPSRRRIWIIDGASSDDTHRLAVELTRDDPTFRVLRLDLANKTAQLNAVLRRLDGEWVMVTDGDAQLPPHTLTTMIRKTQSDPGLAVVGTTVEPVHAHPAERLYWRIVNRTRSYESDLGSASIVTGPCYLFCRRLLRRFPANVVADDVHIAFAAAASGKRVALVDIKVIELRAPTRVAELFTHKCRKADAYLREVFRFLPRVMEMPRISRLLFLWHAAQLVLIPLLVTAAGLYIPLATFEIGFLPATVPLLAGLVTVPIVTAMRFSRYQSSAVRSSLVLSIVMAGVLVATLLLYPFSRQTAHYRRVPPGLPTPGRDGSVP